MTPLDGGVCAVEGVEAAGVAAGLRRSGRPDVALVDAGRPVTAAGVQTRNQVVAAPVRVTARHLHNGTARAVLLNSGQANACTGPAGLELAEASALRTAEVLGCDAGDVLLCSTGVIGVLPDRATLLAGVDEAAGALDARGATRAAEAILTTDTASKQAARGFGGGVVGGMAKGSGMIAPGLATMLAVLTTDAPLDPATAQRLLSTAVDRSFNRISVDGCMSTNDAVLLLATGAAAAPPSEQALEQALTVVCEELAQAVVHDGEGLSHVVHLTVAGARSEADALTVARAVADSVLVRTAVAGNDPNWGRVLAAVGAAPVPIDADRVEVRFGDVTVCRGGMATPFDRAAAVAALSATDVELAVDLALGEQAATLHFADLTHDYVTINAEYTT